MTKHLLVSPEDVRQPGWIKFQDIPVNQYQKSVEDEKDRYSKEFPSDLSLYAFDP